MASYISTSVARKINNIQVGYGEVPLIQEGKRRIWALPGGGQTTNKQKAFDTAKEIDRLIRRRIKNRPEILLGLPRKK